MSQTSLAKAPQKKTWIRYRFKTYSAQDWRPLIYNPAYPCWCSGIAADYSDAVIIAWLPKGEPLEKYWDDAFEIEFTEHDQIQFSDRFPRPPGFIES